MTCVARRADISAVPVRATRVNSSCLGLKRANKESEKTGGKKFEARVCVQLSGLARRRPQMMKPEIDEKCSRH
jgi:hypothetical protein